MSEKTKAKTTIERQAVLREKRYLNNFRQLNEWVHDDDRVQLQEMAKRLRQNRWKKLICEGGKK